MTGSGSRALDANPSDSQPPIDRLLFVADAAVADAAELPPAARAVIDSAAEIYVVTPTLPGRLAWLADDLDRFRHVADDRLDAVLSHMHSIGAPATGEAIRGRVLTVVGDAVATFRPHHILLALRGPQDANWQERRLVEHIEERFGLPVSTYAVDLDGHTSTADGPVLLCYDGSDNATHAAQRAGDLFAGRQALVLTVWQPTAELDGIAWPGAPAGTVDSFVELDRAAADHGSLVANRGVQIAQDAGLTAEPLALKADGPIWKTIVEIADRQDAATIVLGSRGLTGLRSMLLGSVSSAVVRHAARPTLVIPEPFAG
jgi:nucleotide-binding universal stress UspA family protein